MRAKGLDPFRDVILVFKFFFYIDVFGFFFLLLFFFSLLNLFILY